MGSTTFAAVNRSAQGEAQPRRRRLVRAGELGGAGAGGSAAAAAGRGGANGSGADVVDLLSSQSPAAAAPSAAEERQAWRAMDAALRQSGDAGRAQRQPRSRQAPRLSAGGGTDDELDLPLAGERSFRPPNCTLWCTSAERNLYLRFSTFLGCVLLPRSN
jgi:hypothetical protein